MTKNNWIPNPPGSIRANINRSAKRIIRLIDLGAPNEILEPEFQNLEQMIASFRDEDKNSA